MNMDNLAPWCYQRWLAPKDIHVDMDATVGDYAPALSTVQKWVAEFKRGRESLADDLRSERPATATTQENVDRVHHMNHKLIQYK